MIRPNWDIFKAKFSENPQNTFEWLCYLLFCNLYDKQSGIFRYINQAAIETEPIIVDEEVIGWQAKYYNSSLSDNKENIIKTITDVKKYYPEVTRLLFFSNQDWGQSSGKEPKGKKEVELIARGLSISIVWNTSSFFESPFVSNVNADLAKYFFSFDSSTIDAICNQKRHTNSLLSTKNTSIQFNDQIIEIPRDRIITKLLSDPNDLVIVRGQAGVGKSVLIKKIYQQWAEKIPFYVFQATEFDIRNINDLIPECKLSDFLKAHKDEEEKIIVIDSSEKLIEVNYFDPFNEFLVLLKEYDWRIIFTTRNNYFEDLFYLLISLYNVNPAVYQINVLEIEELREIFQKCSISVPKDEKLIELLKTPFYLNEYLKFYDPQENLHYENFKTKIWNRNIRKSRPMRENCFLELAYQRANEGKFFINPGGESEYFDDLVKDDILGHESSGYYITHDIYEEWALEKIIEGKYFNKTNNQDFFDKLGTSLLIRRSFRNWLSEKLMFKNSDIVLFIEESLEDVIIESFWKDDLLVSVLLSNFSKEFFQLYKDRLIHKEDEIRRISFLLRIACKTVDDELSRLIGNDGSNLSRSHFSYNSKVENQALILLAN